MANIIEPKYDNEQITYGFLKKVLEKNSEEDDGDDLTQYSKSFSSPPNPPYYAGWTYSQNNKIYRCIKDRLLGSFSIDDWVVIYDEKQSDLIAENFLFLSEIDLLEQKDGKVESFYQDDDPQNNWDTSVLKSTHEGDYWRYKKDGIYNSYIYTKIATNPITYDWINVNVPICIFNTITGNKNIFTEIPTSYQENDFLKIMNEEMLNSFSEEYQVGDYLYALNSNSEFDSSDWTKKEDELTLKSLQTYYYTTEEINKIVELIDSNIVADIAKSEDSITAYVKENYTTQITTEELTKKVNANGETIEAIFGTNTTEVPTFNLSQLSIYLDQIQTKVSETVTLINDCYTKNEIDSSQEKINTNITQIKNILETFQSSTALSINAINETIQNGVSKVTTTNGTFDENGWNMSKTGEEMSALFNWLGLFVTKDKGKDTEEEMLAVTPSLVSVVNLLVKTFFILKPLRAERCTAISDSTKVGVGIFWVGDD